MAPSLLSVKHINITAAEKSGFFHHKILGFLGLHSLRDTTHIPGILHLPHSGCPDYVDMLVWTTCSLLCVWQCGDETSIIGKQPKRHQCSTVNLWNTDTCRQKASASHHSWTAICPPSTPKSWFPSHKHKSHHKQEVSTLRMPKWRPRVSSGRPSVKLHQGAPAPWKPAAPCQVWGISHCPGNWQCILNLSKESRNYLCQEDIFFCNWTSADLASEPTELAENQS